MLSISREDIYLNGHDRMKNNLKYVDHFIIPERFKYKSREINEPIINQSRINESKINEPIINEHL